MTKRRVLFAPDYRAGIPYQTFLAEALRDYDLEVEYLSDYRRGLPLFRGCNTFSPNLVHIHWPEKYFQKKGDGWDMARVLRYPFDYWLTSNQYPTVLTAHNLFPHNRREETGVFRNVAFTVRKARAVFVHSEAARKQMSDTFGVTMSRCHIIPYGDHAVTMLPPIARNQAREKLELPEDQKVCLVFGTVSPYKNKRRIRHRLVIVGPVLSESFANQLRKLADGNPMIDLRLTTEWLDDSALRYWLSAVDCAIFNYREIFTSGAAALARSFGLPLLIPERLTAADLDEPHSHVLRFDTLDAGFREQLDRALATPPSYELANEWREKTSWKRVAEITAAVYSEIL
jgi:hypothetical protein